MRHIFMAANPDDPFSRTKLTPEMILPNLQLREYPLLSHPALTLAPYTDSGDGQLSPFFFLTFVRALAGLGCWIQVSRLQALRPSSPWVR
jgi:hypothetical protein